MLKYSWINIAFLFVWLLVPCLLACNDGEVGCFDGDRQLGVCFNSTWISRTCPDAYKCSQSGRMCTPNNNNSADSENVVGAASIGGGDYQPVPAVFDGDSQVRFKVQSSAGSNGAESSAIFIVFNITSNRSYFKKNDWLMTVKYRSDLLDGIVKVEGCDFLVYNDISAVVNPFLQSDAIVSAKPQFKTLLIKTRKTIDYGLEYRGNQVTLYIQVRPSNAALIPSLLKDYSDLLQDFRFGANGIDGSQNTGGQASGVSQVVAAAMSKSTNLNCQIGLELYEDVREYLLTFQIEGDQRPRADLAIKFRLPFGQRIVSQIADDQQQPRPPSNNNNISIDKQTAVVSLNMDPSLKRIKVMMRRDLNLVLPSDLLLLDQSIIDLKGQPIDLPITSTIKPLN